MSAPIFQDIHRWTSGNLMYGVLIPCALCLLAAVTTKFLPKSRLCRKNNVSGSELLQSGAAQLMRKQLAQYDLERPRSAHSQQPHQDNPKTKVEERDTYDDIDPLADFEWKTTPPHKYRPYKPKYNLTMSIENTNVSELIEIDRNYVDRVMLRRQIMRENADVVLGAYDIAKPAVDELYIWLTTNYLPTRFPKMFQLHENAETGVTELWNDATSEYFSLRPCEEPEETLKRLGGLVEDDLLFLLPADDGDGYQLKAFVTCFPNGFNTKKKLGLKLREIHTPVPGYKQKLEKSMDRWFSRLQVGTFVRRYNWTITPHDRLFTASGNHLYEGEAVQEVEVDINQTHVRSERQIVHRLSKSRAILFSFKTYLYPITDIKEEGLGEILADAIDGLKTGNVPGMHFYKRAAVWGASVQRYLRS